MHGLPCVKVPFRNRQFYFTTIFSNLDPDPRIGFMYGSPEVHVFQALPVSFQILHHLLVGSKFTAY